MGFREYLKGKLFANEAKLEPTTSQESDKAAGKDDQRTAPPTTKSSTLPGPTPSVTAEQQKEGVDDAKNQRKRRTTRSRRCTPMGMPREDDHSSIVEEFRKQWAASQERHALEDKRLELLQELLALALKRGDDEEAKIVGQLVNRQAKGAQILGEDDGMDLDNLDPHGRRRVTRRPRTLINVKPTVEHSSQS